jgi:hypothetical protein
MTLSVDGLSDVKNSSFTPFKITVVFDNIKVLRLNLLEPIVHQYGTRVA